MQLEISLNILSHFESLHRIVPQTLTKLLTSPLKKALDILILENSQVVSNWNILAIKRFQTHPKVVISNDVQNLI